MEKEPTRLKRRYRLAELIVRRFRVERVGDFVIAIPDTNGNYRASSAAKVERALMQRRSPKGVEVKIGTKWYPIKHRR